jgi:hypothetical protein
MYPIETATARDILSTLFPAHDLHSMDGVSISKDSVDISCSCDNKLTFSVADCDSVGLKFGEITNRLKSLGQTTRSK